VEPVPELALARFAAWFDRACPGAVTGLLRARLLAGGRSNLNYEVSDGTRSWVVRRQP
jgi:aminoglycoside phosphotransferase (APT) family kinase protein